MFYRFKLYSVQVNPNAPRPYETAVFIPEGFNLKAFLFTELWALYHRMWVLAFVLTLIFVTIAFSGQHFGFSAGSMFVLQMGIRLMVGLEANDALRAVYEKRGYVTADMVAAHTSLESEQRFYDRYLPQVQAARA